MFDERTTVASMSAERTTIDFVPSASPTGPELPDMSGSYDRYISSGLYDWRYPRPNRRTLRIMKRCLPAGGRFLDVGAGTGRYTLPLLRVDGASGLALDICPVARKTLAERFAEFVRAERLLIRGGDAGAVALDHPQAFDLALLAFGVLAHVAGRAERLRLLRAIRAMLKPDGTLVLSVPNAKRRFRAGQVAAAPWCVTAGSSPATSSTSAARTMARSRCSITSTRLRRCSGSSRRPASRSRVSGPRACCPRGLSIGIED